ncbi:XdhC family protein [Salibacterium salarium]|uniref:XdhC family protein n=1 Tax=Salibacterium salarium TaxID=284579 RepID=A0A3R9QSH3_9BACI|nr:XdhC family protein [Salibacterium salarium]RSL32394.1 XdhC family protein [Salibacterium salarium]
MEEIHSILQTLAASQQKAILAIIIQVEGSAYRKEGTSMLIQEDGTQVGLLSGGCLENDIIARWQDIWETGARTVEYDMRGFDDLSWGEGSGCNGIIHVLLEPVVDGLRSYLMTVKEYLDQGQSVFMVKKLKADAGRIETLFGIDGSFFGDWYGDVLFPLKQMADDTSQKSGTFSMEELEERVYIHYFHPKPRLFVIGANADARPLVRLAANAGFSVIVSDWRPALCKKEYFPDAARIVIGFPEEVFPTLTFTSEDCVVILTHHFQRDQEILPYLLKEDLRYLGVLGSRTRTARVLGSNEIPEKITSPIGLSINAEGPEEIAVSIVSELIMLSKVKSKTEVVSL